MTATIARKWRIVAIVLICLALVAGVAASCGKKGPDPRKYMPYTLTAEHAPLVICNFLGHGAKAAQGLASLSLVWVTGSSCQHHSPPWPEFYNRTRCINRFDAAVWINGPKRYGDGSFNSNRSIVYCGGGFVVSQVWIEYYTGAGWHAHQLI